MSWNLFGTDINEEIIKGIANAMVDSGIKVDGSEYLIIDDECQGDRDNHIQSLHHFILS